MTDQDLKTYLPLYGDRLAVFAFCSRKDNSHNNTCKSKLYEPFKNKLSKRKPYDSGSNTNQGEHFQPSQNKNATKMMRKIEVGWMHYDDGTQAFKQVRTKRGGGTRKLEMSKGAQKKELIKEATGLFFPSGRNNQGSLTDFKLNLTNYQGVVLDEVTTVGQLYQETELPLLRFYLTTQTKDDRNRQSSPDLAPSMEREEGAQSSTSLSVASSSPTVSSEMLLVGSNATDDAKIEFAVPQAMPSTEMGKRILVVHRGQVLPELIAHFSDDGIKEADIKIQLVLPDGERERTYDESGVVRDCLSEFWNEFYDQCTVGGTFRVPFLRHDFGPQQWESVGRIIAFGWEREKYLPVKIAPVILEQAALGYVKSDLVENFLKYLPESERTVFELWLSDFHSVDQEELVEILDNNSCRKIPTASNVNEILQELAHKTLVQEPAYVIKQWANILSMARHSFEELSTVYETLQPTVRKVLKSLIFPEAMNVQQKDIQKYLTTYIKNAEHHS